MTTTVTVVSGAELLLTPGLKVTIASGAELLLPRIGIAASNISGAVLIIKDPGPARVQEATLIGVLNEEDVSERASGGYYVLLRRHHDRQYLI